MSGSKARFSNELEWQAALLILFASILTGGGYLLLSKALTVGLVGLMVFWKPPRQSLGLILDIGAVLLLVSALLSFAPIPEILRPDWWMEAKYTHEIALPSSLTPQPLVSLEALVTFITGLAWLYTMGDLGINRVGRQRILGVFTFVIGLLAVGLIVGQKNEWHYPFADTFAHMGIGFSYFPNRNHTGLLLAIGGISAFGLAFSFFTVSKLKSGIFGIVTLVCAMGLVLNVSRAGIVLFVVGVGLYTLRLLRDKRYKLFIGLFVPVLVIAGSIFSTSGNQTADRLMGMLNDDVAERSARSFIFSGATEMIKDNWALGVGLGDFSPVFMHYRHDMNREGTILHPESDWLWLQSELGVLAGVGMLVLVFGIFISFDLGNFKKLSSYRFIPIIMLILFLIHSLIDVPVHRITLALVACFIFGMARHGKRMPMALSPWWGRIVGAALVAASLYMGKIYMADSPDTVQSVRRIYSAQIRNDLKFGNEDNARRNITKWIHHEPLNYLPYYFMGILAYRIEDVDTALTYFRAARFLEPQNVSIRLNEGHMWLRYSSALTAEAWGEAIDVSAAVHKTLHPHRRTCTI